MKKNKTHSENIHLGLSLETYGEQHQIQSIAVLLRVINQSTSACEMEDSWRVQYSSQREQLCPRQSYDVSFILSVVSLLLLPPFFYSLCLCPSLSLSGFAQSPVEAMMKLSSLYHT